FVVPIAAWLLGATGWRPTFRLGLIAPATVPIVWPPFVPGGGIEGSARNLDAYGNQTFSIASPRAWNAWWIMPQASRGRLLAAPASAAIADILPEGGPVALVGSLAILVLAAASLWVLVHPAAQPEGEATSAGQQLREPAAEGRSIPAQVVR